MSYNVVPFEQTSVPIGEQLVTRTKADAAEASITGATGALACQRRGSDRVDGS